MRKLSLILSLFLFNACASSSGPSIQSQEVIYKTDKTKMVGYIAKPRTIKEKLPGILVVHEWWGQTDYPRKRARMLAKQGYVAMAVDMYGDRKIADHPKTAKKFSSQVFEDIKGLRKRFLAAYEKLQQNPDVDPSRIAAVGYCFGGSVVIEMAKQGLGLDLELVASFHGGLKTPSPIKKGLIKAEILVFNGADDPLVKEEEIESFKSQMNKVDANYIFIDYKDAKHGFTNPEATKLGEKYNLPLAYNVNADVDSWHRMSQIFNNKLK